MKLPLTYYLSDDVPSLAKSLLGKYLITNINGVMTGGMITETEAYEGVTDRASHAYGGLRSKRTEVMYATGGRSYVYLCYGIHYLFNIVTNQKEVPHAVLVRGIFPVIGIEEMMIRTGKSKAGYALTNGPGKLSKALGITLRLNGVILNGQEIWIEDRGIEYKYIDITTTHRVGVDYAGPDALLPYRFILDYRKYIA
ncbi:MAG: DNA-3-methyladenine glycosylase [Marinilabiliales bacterium]|nr:MAG: DNA-3-methyladenine glycosylase [Marinilabiliales bacterium]